MIAYVYFDRRKEKVHIWGNCCTWRLKWCGVCMWLGWSERKGLD